LRRYLHPRLLAPPFTTDGDAQQSSRRIGLTKVVRWLEAQPGASWQDRWVASGADAVGNLAWRGMELRVPEDEPDDIGSCGCR
jgi:hypothetical protein